MATLTQGQIQALAVTAGLPNAALMAAIAMAESSGRTDVVNSMGMVGLWQISPAHLSEHPTWTPAWLKNPLNNATAAKTVLQAQGLGAWEAYTNGAYLKYFKGTVPATGDAPQGIGDIIVGGIAGIDGVVSSVVSNPVSAVTDTASGIADGAKGIATGAEALAHVVTAGADWVSKASNWVRIGYVLGGALLVIVGLATIADKPMLETTKAFLGSGAVKKLVKK